MLKVIKQENLINMSGEKKKKRACPVFVLCSKKNGTKQKEAKQPLFLLFSHLVDILHNRGSLI